MPLYGLFYIYAGDWRGFFAAGESIGTDLKLRWS
jgi:hypothetical protein